MRTNVQKDKIISVLETEKGLAEGSLCTNFKLKSCGHTGRCAMGALLFHAGVTNKQLRELGQTKGNGADEVWSKFGQLLHRRYGLGFNHVSEIISSNDGVYSPWTDEEEAMLDVDYDLAEQMKMDRTAKERVEAVQNEVRNLEDYDMDVGERYEIGAATKEEYRAWEDERYS